jgi:hypothetical protein
MTSAATTPRIQWRWDRFDAKKVTSVAWASRNCIGPVNSDETNSHEAMQRRVLLDEKASTRIINAEVHQLLHDAAEITGLTYSCKLTQHLLPCISIKDIRKSWTQDGGEENLRRLAWMFYYYGTEIHKLGRSTLTHGEWVEQKVMTALNVEYVHLSALPIASRTCLQQLYSRKYNDIRANILRRGATIQHSSTVSKEQPKVKGIFKKNFKRGKSTFFMTLDVTETTAWHKVRDRNVQINRCEFALLTTCEMWK